MSVEVRLPSGGKADRISAAVDRVVAWIARHWLAIFNLIVGVFVFLPFLAPILMEVGLTLPARAIYLLYRPTCHQLPERSFFLFGDHVSYSVEELEAEGALPQGTSQPQRQIMRYTGDSHVGYKIAICERDIAIYGGILLTGLVFGVVRRRYARIGRPIPKMPLRIYLIFLLPMIIDGATQLVGLRESTWLLRLVTGVLFGAATVWLTYPYVDEAMRDTLKSMSTERAKAAEVTP